MRLLAGRGGPLLTGRPGPRRAGPRRPGGPSAMGTGMGFLLIAVGAVLLFAVPAGSTFGLNLHDVGIIVIVAGVIGLVLPLVLRGRPWAHPLRRLVNPTGVDDPTVHDIKSAAAADVAQVREDDKYFSPDSPEQQQDEL